MENRLDIYELREQQALYWERFMETGNLYFYLIAQEKAKIIKAKLENDKKLEEEQGLGL